MNITVIAQTSYLHYEALDHVSNIIRGTACINSSTGRRGSAAVAPPSGDVLIFKTPPHNRFWVTRRIAL